MWHLEYFKHETNIVTIKEGLNDVEASSVAIPFNIGFIGSGNMAQALMKGFIESGLINPAHTIASAPSSRNSDVLIAMGVQKTTENQKVLNESDVIFLCVKPHVLPEVLHTLQPIENSHKPLFVSVVSGIPLRKLEKMLERIVSEPRVIRAMPNTPCLIGQGCSAYSLGNNTLPNDGTIISALLSSVGMCREVQEHQLDAVCGLAGSGPAYIFSAIEALADGAVKMGLPRDVAQLFAAHMVKGAASMVLETGKHPGQLKDEVCSPGGTTIAALHTLERNGFRNCLMSAVEASTLKSAELGRGN